MRTIIAAVCGALLAGCASYSGRGLEPGQSTAAEVEALMGPAAARRPGPNGETILWFPRMPYGDGTYAARIGADGRLIGIEQRLTEENIAKIERGKTTADQVLELFGPAYRVDQFPRMQREIWTYKMQVFPFPKALFVQFSPDHVVREAYYMDDPEIPRLGAGHRTSFRR
jgi:hypothetical protein